MIDIDQKTADYIVTYFSHLLNDKEKLANRHLSSLIKIGTPDGSNDTQKLTNVYRKAGWLTEDQDVAIVKYSVCCANLEVAGYVRIEQLIVRDWTPQGKNQLLSITEPDLFFINESHILELPM